MKAFLIILLVLVLAAGAVFYFGWIQIQLPPGHFGVVFTKTSGYDTAVVRPGEFVWRWEKLVPTNLTLYRFDLHPHRLEVSFERRLPSAELYASIVPERPDFSIRGHLDILFAVRPEALPALVEEQRLTPDSLSDFYAAAAQRITQEVQNRLRGLEAADFELPLEPVIREGLSADLAWLEIISLELGGLEVPDPQVYELARESYRSLVESSSAARNAAAARLAVEAAEEDRRDAAEEGRRENLRKYGELFNQYPVLLKALAIQRLGGNGQTGIPGLDLSDVLDFSAER